VPDLAGGGTGRARQRRKRHHYVPESYLRAWADDKGQIAVRRRDRADAFCTSTINVAVESDLYAFPTDEGMDDALEVALAAVEGPLSGHLAELRDGRTPRKGTEGRAEISYLLALQLVRTPEHLDSVMFPVEAAEFTNERPISRDGMERFLTEVYLGESPSEGEIQGALDFTNYQLMRVGLPTKQEAFSTFFRIASEELAPRLAKMAWATEVCLSSTFFTTDRPVVVWKRPSRRPENQGIGIESADEVRFPLGPNHLLVLRPRFPEHRTFVDAERVAEVNRHLVSACYRMSIGTPGDKSILEQLRLRTVRPAIRFNSGSLYRNDGQGEIVDTGQTVLHMYTPQGDEV
jgi:hypothetical protein